MRWEGFFSTAVIIFVILLFQWPKMKQKPKKDKGALIVLLLIGLVLSMFNLPQMDGPTTWIDALFKPFGQFMEK
ncbi:hypothetical protein V7122_09515 [Bacillus sp. JJ1532]|uniref:hypothetical protein n=1 Tax=unclassified Bacillus (in: firmicutes) TaxID=185979 RepID=UPI003000111D